MTALHMVNRSRVTRNERVIITGASGGVGLALVQLCKLKGAEVIAISSGNKAEPLKRFGADHVVSRDSHESEGEVKKREKFCLSERLKEVLRKGGDGYGDGDVHVIFDNVAGEMVMDLLEVLSPGGRYVSAGAIGGQWVKMHWPTFYLKHLDLLGCLLASPEEFLQLIQLVVDGYVTPVVHKTYSLMDLVPAQIFFSQKKFVGKLVIDLSL
eukprot:TRINITY_DN6034_c0_g1_i3.p1 TRINITY_DN6034_c0_g1~~TRINITY_DN6034_c0_g1_i3.p1  ORF type:complete len:211 (-),score=49.04 TRINITY_DN6034_c0_g1_i3:164-796(-)